MRILIAEAFTPFSGEAGLAEPLGEALRRRGADTDIVRLPSAADAEGWNEQLAAWRMLELDEACGDPIDRLIALASPAEALRHTAKTVWVVRELPLGIDPASSAGFLGESRNVHYAEAALRHGTAFEDDLLPIPARNDQQGWDHVAEVLAR